MPRRPDLVFWQGSLSGHQSPLLRALSTELEIRVLLVAAGGAAKDRRSLGWDSLDWGETSVVVTSSASEHASLVRETADAAHVFSGVGAYPIVDAARRAITARRRSGPTSVLTESWDPRGMRGRIRLARSRFLVPRELRDIDLVFAIGSPAYRQLRRIGIAEEKLAPFAYAVDESSVGLSPLPELARSRVAWVGDLASWKNPVLLIDALRLLPDLDPIVTIAGDGPLRSHVERLVRTSGRVDQVRLIGRIPPAAARNLIRTSDLLVHSSVYDGWGAVVQEALTSGTPAIVSDAAGAADLIVSPLQGVVFRSGDAHALAEGIRGLLDRGGQYETRERLLEWSRLHISPLALARYLVHRLERPGDFLTPPWIEAT